MVERIFPEFSSDMKVTHTPRRIVIEIGGKKVLPPVSKKLLAVPLLIFVVVCLNFVFPWLVPLAFDPWGFRALGFVLIVSAPLVVFGRTRLIVTGTELRSVFWPLTFVTLYRLEAHQVLQLFVRSVSRERLRRQHNEHFDEEFELCCIFAKDRKRRVLMKSKASEYLLAVEIILELVWGIRNARVGKWMDKRDFDLFRMI